MNETTTTPDSAAQPSGTGEDDEVDEQFRALLEGLRTSLPGVQVLFGFLLVAPFQSDFDGYDRSTIVSFTVAFLSAAVSSMLLIAPSVHQRLRAPRSGLRRRSKKHLIIATWLTIAGTVAMGVAIVATVFLVSTFVFDTVWSSAVAASLAAVLVWAWFYLPLTWNSD